MRPTIPLHATRFLRWLLPLATSVVLAACQSRALAAEELMSVFPSGRPLSALNP